MTEEIGTVVSTPLGPSPSQLDFVVTKGIAHRGQFVEVEYSEGTMICLITNVIKTNRYFERADSVKEFEASGAKIFEQFPTTEWEYLLAQTRPLGVFSGEKIKRSSYPPSPGAKVKIATAENLKKFLGFDEENGLLLGEVEYHDLPVKINLSRLLKKHLAILAMSGAGKSYLVSVILEELLSRKKEQGRIATILLDVHGEYSSFAEALPASDKKHSDYSRHAKIVRARDIRIGVSKLSVGMFAGIISGLSAPQKRDLGKIISKLQKEMRSGLGPYDLNSIKTELLTDSEIKDNTKSALLSCLFELEDLHLFEKTDEPSINDLVKPGQLTIIDLSDITSMKKKQIIVSYFGQKLFYERRQKRLPPFVMILEEAHQFCPERSGEESATSKSIIRTIAREGRKFGASICIISQRPVHLDTTTLSQCVVPSTKVILGDGLQKSIGSLENCWNTFSAKSFDADRKGLTNAAIANYFKNSPAQRKVFEVRTENNRAVVATEDHPFWVKGKGWVKLKDVGTKDNVAVLPQWKTFDEETNTSELLTQEQLFRFLPKTINRERLLKELLRAGFSFPLLFSDEKLLILARLLGHLFGDGTLHPEYASKEGYYSLKITFSGKAEDLREILEDIGKLGFKNNQKVCVSARDSVCNFVSFGKKKISGKSTCFKTGIVSLWAILRALGAPVGDKTNKPTEIPEWVFRAPKKVKREFLAAYMGSEAQKIRIKKRFPERISVPFSKDSTLEENGIGFAKHTISLLGEFGVKASLYTRPYSIRKDGSVSTQFIVSINRFRKNIMSFCKNVSYRYSKNRESHARLVLEYLTYLENKTYTRIECWKKIVNESQNMCVSGLSKKYGLQKKIISNWLSMQQQQVRLTPSQKVLSFDEWKETFTDSLSDGLVWDTVESKIPAIACDVRDLTIKTHSAFFANEFLTHNCNTHIILRITNPYDLKHISESSESLDSKSQEMISGLRVGEALIVGEAANYPVFFKVRERKSLESRHEISLEKAAVDFEEGKTKEEKETEEFL